MNLLYWFSHKALRGIFKLSFRAKYNGLDNIPQSGPMIIVANHVSNIDPPVLGAAINRKIHYMAKSELFENPLLAKIMRVYGTFPVERGRADTKAIRQALKILNQGKALGIFPEGTRSKTGKLGRAKLGSVLLATKSQVPLLPVGLIGTNHPFKNGVTVNVGPVFTLDDYYDRKLDRAEMKEAGKLIMNKIGELI